MVAFNYKKINRKEARKGRFSELKRVSKKKNGVKT